MQPNNYLAIDVGEKRVGLALASAVAKLPAPYTTLSFDEMTIQKIAQIADDEHVGTLVVGLPKNRNDQPTQQTEFTQKFIEQLASLENVEIVTQDETLSSKRARQELERRKKPYEKSAVDALAATYILEDYLRETGVIT